MTNSFATLRHSEALFALERVLLDQLYVQVENVFTQQRQADSTRRDQKPRQRKQGAGRKYANELRTRLVMTRFWLRVYPSYRVLAFFFSVDQSTICRNLAEIMAVLQTLTDCAFERPSEERKKLRSPQAVMDAFPPVVLVVDGKEQRICRPKTKKDAKGTLTATPKPYYSDKKKCPTLKNAIAVRPCGEGGSVSLSYPGGENHDLTVTRKNKLLDRLDPQQEAVMTDSGYDGLGKDSPEHTIYQVAKARRNHPLTPEQKDFNRVLGRYRIIVEHTLAQMNQFQILAQMYRHPRDRHGEVVRVVAGLVNRRIAEHPLKRYDAQLGLAI